MTAFSHLRRSQLTTPPLNGALMKTDGIHTWLDVMHAACPPGRTPTPTVPTGWGTTR